MRRNAARWPTIGDGLTRFMAECNGRVSSSLRNLSYVLCASLALAACQAHPDRQSPPTFDVLIIVLDACRADKIGAYGFDRPTTPTLDAFARDPDTVIFRRHHTQSDWTKPSTASLFSGLYVHQHRVTIGFERDPPEPVGIYQSGVLDARVDAMAEQFHDAGFTTVAGVTNVHLMHGLGFDQGFAEYDDVGSDANQLREFTDRIRTAPGRAFGYLHLLGCHNPFPAAQRDAEYFERYGFAYDEPSRQAAGVNFTAGASEFQRAIRLGSLQLDGDDARFLHLIYEAKLRWTDAHMVQPLLEGLRASHRYDDSLIIVTADHGEELYDHGGYGHGYGLWEEILHVPLIVKFPKGRRPPALGPEVRELTNSVDLLPSLLELIGRPPPAARIPGVPIFRGMFAGYAFAERATITDRALLQGQYKLIEAVPGPLLFDLDADPAEHHDLASTQPERVKAMRAAARDIVQRTPHDAGAAPMAERELQPESIEQLRNLGYAK